MSIYINTLGLFKNIFKPGLVIEIKNHSYHFKRMITMFVLSTIKLDKIGLTSNYNSDCILQFLKSACI
jgi:hypothetical protein